MNAWQHLNNKIFRNSQTKATSSATITSYGDALRLLKQYGVTGKVEPGTVRGLPAYFYCRDHISSLISGNPFSVYRSADNGRQKADDHPLYYLIKERPHPYLSQIDFIKTLIGFMLDYGNGYAAIRRDGSFENRPTHMDIWHPEYVSVKIVDGQKIYKNHNTKEVLHYADMIHLMDIIIDPLTLVADSRISIARKTFEESLVGREMFNTVMKKGTFLSGYLKFAGNLRKQTRDEVIEQWNKAYQGYTKIGATGLTEAGGEYVQLKVPFRDLQFMEQRNLSLYDTALIMGFKPGHLGSKEGESFNTLEQYNIEKMQYPIIPLARKIEQEFNYKLIGPSERIGKEKLFVKFDFKGLLQASVQDRKDLYQTLLSLGVMTQNDVLRLEDMNTFADGDNRLVQMGFTTLQNILDGKPSSLFPEGTANFTPKQIQEMERMWQRLEPQILEKRQNGNHE